ncbi:type VI secretion system VasD/TssJ family lipoprotein [Variovorax sp. TBS-050B]|nr:type VI secretion system VasD/TssJ family lipoprotein [Variovorax sp. TBS-050B]
MPEPFAVPARSNQGPLARTAKHRKERHPAKPWQLAALLPLALSGCSVLSGGGDAPPQKEPAKLDIAIKAGADLNVDIKGRGNPMLLRVYELKSEVAFQEADFFALQKTDKAALGADLLAVDQFIIRPGETRKITRKSNPETTAIGVFAGYRDLPNATWRVVHKMQPAAEKSWYRLVMPSHKAKLMIDLQKNAIVMTDLETGDRPVQYANESLKELEPKAVDDTVRPIGEAASGVLQEMPKVPEKQPADSIKSLVK